MSEAIRHTRALALIVQLWFRVAKTMPELPHEYTVRDSENPEREALYFELFRIIQADGVTERWQDRNTCFLYPGDGRKYWAMTTIQPESREINRMRIEDDI